jgi:hypothetical protein
MQRSVTSQTATKAARTRRSARKYPCAGGSTAEHRVGVRRAAIRVTWRDRRLPYRQRMQVST